MKNVKKSLSQKFFTIFPGWLLLTITLVLVLFVVLLFYMLYLSTDKTAKGSEDEIYVVADSVEFENLKDTLKSAFEKEIYTPQPEKVFTLKRINPSDINNYKDKKNILLVAPLNSQSAGSDLIKSVVDSSTENQLQQDSNLIVYKNDLWAKEQIVTVLSAPSTKQLESKISQNAGVLSNTFQKASDDRLRSYLYNPDNEQKKIEGGFLKNYGWIIYVHPSYKISSEYPVEKFVELERSEAGELDRRIFIYWIENAAPEYLNKDSIKVIRNRLTKKFYKTKDDTTYIVVSEDYFTVNEVNFNGKYSLFTQGLWNRNMKEAGGPFVNYFFYDENTKRVYMIDGSIFAPKYYKRNLIQQVDVMLQSFRTKTELSQDRIEDLLDAAKE